MPLIFLSCICVSCLVVSAGFPSDPSLHQKINAKVAFACINVEKNQDRCLGSLHASAAVLLRTLRVLGQAAYPSGKPRLAKASWARKSPLDQQGKQPLSQQGERDHPIISEMAVNFYPFVTQLVTFKMPSTLSKTRTQPFTFFFFSASLDFKTPSLLHLRWSKLWPTNSINIQNVIHLGDKEAAADFHSAQALPIPEGLRVISRWMWQDAISSHRDLNSCIKTAERLTNPFLHSWNWWVSFPSKPESTGSWNKAQ